MSADYLMGLDVGGSAGHCVLVDVSDGSITAVSQPWRNITVRGDDPWTLDLDTTQLWRQLGEVASRAIREPGIAAKQVIGVAVTSEPHRDPLPAHDLAGASEQRLASQA